MATHFKRHTLPALPYEYNALEPYICEEIMVLHHSKHHQNYVNGLNAAEESLAKFSEEGNTNGIIALQPALQFNLGGHVNHSLFWTNLAPSSAAASKPAAAPTLLKQIEKDFGSLDALKSQLNTRTAAIQGSGWGWVGWNAASQRLEVSTTLNQDRLLSHEPIIGIDIWEHAFYLQYKNVKADYLEAIWNVINFEEAESRFQKCIAPPTNKL